MLVYKVNQFIKNRLVQIAAGALAAAVAILVSDFKFPFSNF